MKILALIQTKTNYKNLNGQWLEVKEFAGTRVSCKLTNDEHPKGCTIDFNLVEIKELKELIIS